MAIKSSKNADTKALHALRRVARWVNVETVALRKLRMMEAAAVLDDLRVPPGNRLEALAGNDQWRVCFVWTSDGPINVEIVDYH